MSSILKQIENKYPEDTFVYPTGFETAIIGVEENSLRVVLSMKKVMELLMDGEEDDEDETAWEKARQHFDYNMTGYIGEKTPIFVDDDFE